MPKAAQNAMPWPVPTRPSGYQSSITRHGNARPLVVNLCFQTRQYDQIVPRVLILPVLGDLGPLLWPLLLLLANVDPLFRGKVLPELSENIRRLPETLEKRAVQRVENYMIVGSWATSVGG